MTTVVAGRVTCSGCSRTLCEYPGCPGTAKLEYHGYCNSHRLAYLGHLRDAEGNIDSEIYSCEPAGKFFFCRICANQPIADASHVSGRRHKKAMSQRQNGVGMCRPLPQHIAMDRGCHRGRASQAASSRAFELPPELPSLPQESTSSPSFKNKNKNKIKNRSLGGTSTSDVQEPRQSHVDEMGEEERCAVCLDRRRTHAASPCGHYQFCEQCSVDIQKRGRPCPICGGTVQHWLKIFG